MKKQPVSFSVKCVSYNLAHVVQLKHSGPRQDFSGVIISLQEGNQGSSLDRVSCWQGVTAAPLVMCKRLFHPIPLMSLQ